MKRFLTLFSVILTVLSIRFNAHAAIITAIQNGGNWNSITSWFPCRLPQCGDTIIIPQDIEIKVTEDVDLNENTEACSAVRIFVTGKLRFTNGAKIRLAAGACITVEQGGMIIPSAKGGGASEAILIHHTKVWQASEGILHGVASMGCKIALPVSLLEFTVSNNNHVFNLDWTVASEQNLAYYELFVSGNGLDWELIHARTASGNQTVTRYTYEYQPGELSKDLTYFRLSSTNANGNSEVLAQKTASFEFSIPGNEELLVLPNPTQQNKLTMVAFELGNEQECEIMAIDHFGQIVLRNNVTGNKGANIHSIESNRLKTGLYIIQVRNSEKVRSVKLVIP